MLYELTLAAETDMRSIIRYTRKEHGNAQVRVYTDCLKQCVQMLAEETGRIVHLPEFHQHLRMIHCRHHYIFGLMRPHKTMLIVAFLHERMDVTARLKDRI